MRRFVIREWNESDPNPGWITEAELKQRFIMAVNAHLAYNDWPNTLRILLHGVGEQSVTRKEAIRVANETLEKAEQERLPNYDTPCYICKKAANLHEPWCSRGKPADDEWERWVEKSPFGSCEFEGTTAENWAAIVKQFFREMPREK